MMQSNQSAGSARCYHYAVLKSNAPCGTVLVAPNGTSIRESDLFVSKTDPRRQVVLFTTKEQSQYHAVKDLVNGAYVTQFKGPFTSDDAKMYSYLRGTYMEKRDMVHTPGVVYRPLSMLWKQHPQVEAPDSNVTGTKFGIDENTGVQYVVGPICKDDEPDTKRSRSE